MYRLHYCIPQSRILLTDAITDAYGWRMLLYGICHRPPLMCTLGSSSDVSLEFSQAGTLAALKGRKWWVTSRRSKSGPTTKLGRHPLPLATNSTENDEGQAEHWTSLSFPTLLRAWKQRYLIALSSPIGGEPEILVHQQRTRCPLSKQQYRQPRCWWEGSLFAVDWRLEVHTRSILALTLRGLAVL